jgi:L-lactate dehydrogenase
VLNDERAAIPIGSFHRQHGVTLSLSSVFGRTGIIEALEPQMSEEAREGLERSAQSLREALEPARRIYPAKILI